MATVANILTYVGYGLNRTISTSSEPSQVECIQWINQTLDWIIMTLAELRSELGRTRGSITTLQGTISAATQANPCQITVTGHGFGATETPTITIKDVVGMTEINNLDFTGTYVDANNLTIGVDSSSYTAYSSGGYIYTATYDDIASDFYAPVVMATEDGEPFSGWIEKSTERVPLMLVTEAEMLDYMPGQVNEPEAFYINGSNNVVFVQTPDDDYAIKIPYYQTQTVTQTTDTIPFYGIFNSLIIEAIVNKYLYRTREDMGIEWDWFSFVKERAEKIIKLRKLAGVRIS